MKKKKEVQKIPYIDYVCRVGEKVFWKNLKGEKFEGRIKEWNDNIATVVLEDGTEMQVEC